MPPTIHRPIQPPPALRYCFQCFRPQDATVRLKLCSGCRVAEYCSKECQKAAWPKHKYVPPLTSHPQSGWRPPICALFGLEKKED